MVAAIAEKAPQDLGTLGTNPPTTQAEKTKEAIAMTKIKSRFISYINSTTLIANQPGECSSSQN